MLAPRFEHIPATAFRGTRDYVHSTDLYEDTVVGADAAGLLFDGPIDLRISGRIVRAPIYLFERGQIRRADAAAVCRFVSRGIEWTCSINEGVAPVESAPTMKSGLPSPLRSMPTTVIEPS